MQNLTKFDGKALSVSVSGFALIRNTDKCIKKTSGLCHCAFELVKFNKLGTIVHGKIYV